MARALEAHREPFASSGIGQSGPLIAYRIDGKRYGGRQGYGVFALARDLLAAGCDPWAEMQTFTAGGTPSLRNRVAWFARWATPSILEAGRNPRPYRERPPSA